MLILLTIFSGHFKSEDFFFQKMHFRWNFHHFRGVLGSSLHEAYNLKDYCDSCLSGHFEKSGFVRLDSIGSKSPLEGTRELKIEAKFAVDTGEPHKKEL